MRNIRTFVKFFHNFRNGLIYIYTLVFSFGINTVVIKKCFA